jgi:hypothetical protein
MRALSPSLAASLHLTVTLSWWWLWVPLLAVYVAGCALVWLQLLLAGSVTWWDRLLVLTWPLALLYRLARAVLLLDD